MKNNLFKDTMTAFIVLALIAVSVYLVSIAIGLFIFFVGFVVPGWIILLVLTYVLFHKCKKI